MNLTNFVPLFLCKYVMMNKRNIDVREINYMQQGMFVEKLVKRKKRGAEKLLSFMIVLSAIFLILICLILPILLNISLLLSISAFAVFGIGYLAYRLITGLNQEFEYSIVNDELVVDRIIAQRKRKNVFTGSIRDFKLAAPVTNSEFSGYCNRNIAQFDFRSGEEGTSDWFIVTAVKGVETLLVLEPDDRFIATFRKYNPRNIRMS